MKYLKSEISLVKDSLNDDLETTIKMIIKVNGNTYTATSKNYTVEKLVDCISLGYNIDSYEICKCGGCGYSSTMHFEEFRRKFCEMGIMFNIVFRNDTISKMLNGEIYKTFTHVM